MVQRAEQLAPVEDSQVGFEPTSEYEQLPPYAKAEVDALFLSARFPERSFEKLLEEQLAEQRNATEKAVLTVVEPVVEEPEPEVVVPEKSAAKVVAKKPKLKVVGPKFEHVGAVDMQQFADRFERFVASVWVGPYGKVGKATLAVYTHFLPGRDGRWQCETQKIVSIMKKLVLALELDDPKDRKQRAYMIKFLDQFAA